MTVEKLTTQQKQKTTLDNLSQFPYHSTQAIYLSSQSLQCISDKKLRIFGFSCLNFCTIHTCMVQECGGMIKYEKKITIEGGVMVAWVRQLNSVEQYKIVNRE